MINDRGFDSRQLHNLRLNLSKVPNGLYLVNIYTKNGELLDVRLVKQ